MKQGVLGLALGLALGASPARAEVRTYVLAIGNNAVPLGSEDARLSPLRYADDDAAAVASFMKDLSREIVLLSVLDRDSQLRFPELARIATTRKIIAGDRIADRAPTRQINIGQHYAAQPDACFAQPMNRAGHGPGLCLAPVRQEHCDVRQTGKPNGV